MRRRCGTASASRDDDVEQLARHAVAIENHYGRPMDIEWGKDGIDGGLYILQARPETVQSRRAAGSLSRFRLNETGRVLAEGRAIGQRIGAGSVRILTSIDQMAAFKTGDVLVADMTDPDWEPIMKRASAIVTNRGGRTCHAAIIARELGIPAVVGTGDATDALSDGLEVTVSCADGETGLIYEGLLDFSVEETEITQLPEAPVKVMMNVGTPEQAFTFAQLPNHGVGLARLEFIINRQIGIHPKALLNLDDQPADVAAEIRERIAAYDSPRDYYIKRLAEGRGHHRGGLRAGAGDCAHVRLQVQRVRQPDRRPRLRAARREPDDRLPRRLTVPGAVLPGLLRPRVRGPVLCPQRDGPDQRQADDPVRADPGRGPRRHRTAGGERPHAAARTASRSIMMCETPVQRPARR